MVLRHPGGEVVLRRALVDHSDWTCGGVTHLVAEQRWEAACPAPATRIRLTDAAGRTAEEALAETGGGAAGGGWATLSLPLARLQGVDLSALRDLAWRVTTATPGVLSLDAIRLENRSAAPAARPPAGLRVGHLAGLPGAPPAPSAGPAAECALRADVCVVGGGSGGLGAALAAAHAGARVILLEREAMLGGTSTAGGISNWEPGPGCSLAREIHERLQRIPGAVISNKKTYDETLTRAGRGSIQFEPEAFAAVVLEMLRETGTCRVLLGVMGTEVTVDTGTRRLLDVGAVGADGVAYRIRARTFIDGTGGAFLCQAAGCEIMLGADSRERFGEPAAPVTTEERLNAIEQVYRIRPAASPVRQELPPGTPPRSGGAAWPLPSGDFFVNTCGGLAPGWLLLKEGYDGARAELGRRALAHWSVLQQTHYPGYELDRLAPMLAIRESHRIVGEYVLTQNDLTAGLRGQRHPDVIAVADHPMDTHGAGGGLGAVAAPYGIPFRCLRPKGGWPNLLVACRGASFSHIAASSCRLSRTMLALGHAAGLAAAQCAARGCDTADVDVAAIQAELGMPPPLP
jgi:hypothetical protein